MQLYSSTPEIKDVSNQWSLPLLSLVLEQVSDLNEQISVKRNDCHQTNFPTQRVFETFLHVSLLEFSYHNEKLFN